MKEVGENMIESLLVVAGASCSGKTTFINNLRNSPEPNSLPADLKVSSAADFEFHDAIDWNWPNLPAVEKPFVCLHYDIFRPLTFQLPSFETDSALALMEKARRVSIITLWEPPELLAARNRARRKRLWRALLRSRSIQGLRANHENYRAKRRRRQIMQLWMDDPRRLWTLYQRWFLFCQEAGVDGHWSLRTANGSVFKPLNGAMPDAPLWT